MGGNSAERAISLSTGRQIMAALDPAKYESFALDAGAEGSALPAGRPALSAASVPQHSTLNTQPITSLNLQPLTASPESRPDVVVIALHGKGGEDGTVQGALEVLGIPYTGSGVLASALAMDKVRTNKLLRAEGIPVPYSITLERRKRPTSGEIDARIAASFGYPVAVKPVAQGSTIGCSIARGVEQLELAVEAAFAFDSTVMVEEFIQGTEITAGLLGNDEPQVLPLIEIIAKGGFYDYEAKYAPGGSEHVIPARISVRAAERAREYARRCHLALGCRGMSRVDMIVRGGEPVVLEVNTIPGMTPTSLLPDAARAAGIGFAELLDKLIGYALSE